MELSIISIGNSKGIRLSKTILNKFNIKEKVNLEETEEGILITPVKEEPRQNWDEEFKKWK